MSADWPAPVRAALMNQGPMPIADVKIVAAHLGWGDMAALRDEVLRMRDEAQAYADLGMGFTEYDEARVAAYATVLDLIDKQREGQ